MLEISMTTEEADLLLEILVDKPETSPLSNVYNNVLNKRINDGMLWAHVKKHLIK